MSVLQWRVNGETVSLEELVTTLDAIEDPVILRAAAVNIARWAEASFEEVATQVSQRVWQAERARMLETIKPQLLQIAETVKPELLRRFADYWRDARAIAEQPRMLVEFAAPLELRVPDGLALAMAAPVALTITEPVTVKQEPSPGLLIQYDSDGKVTGTKPRPEVGADA